MSAIRQNYTKECEAAINKLINAALQASYVYMSMAYHFDRDDVALKGFQEYFKKKSGVERENAEKLMSYQNSRGGRLVYQTIKAPQLEWSTHSKALEEALSLERGLNDGILALSKLAVEKNDPHLCHYLNDSLITDAVDAISDLGKLLTNAKICGDGLGVYVFDKESMS